MNAMRRKLWMCPNGCEIDHVLVCDGPSSGDPDSPNLYFQMKLDGTYKDLFADGTSGVNRKAHEHADGGCCNEPYCPECHTECIRESDEVQQSCKVN